MKYPEENSEEKNLSKSFRKSKPTTWEIIRVWESGLQGKENVTIRELADHWGVSRSQMIKYISGKTPLPIWRLCYICRRYGFTWEELGAVLDTAYPPREIGRLLRKYK